MFVFLAILALGVLIIVHEGGHYLVARLSGMRVDRFSIGFGPALWQFRRGETEFQIGAIPLGGFVQIAGLNPQEETIAADDPRAYPNRPVYQRLATIFAGPATNYLFAVLMMALVFNIFGVPTAGHAPEVTMLVESSPAEQAGVQLGDEVLSIDGKKVKELSDVAPIIDASKGNPVDVLVQREGEEKHIRVTPRAEGTTWRIGIQIQGRETFVKAPVGAALQAAVVYPYEISKGILKGLGRIITRKEKAEFSGPVGIVKVLKGQMARGPEFGLSMTAFISVLLGLFNLLPLPALDGGRLVFLMYEGMSRRRVNQRVEQTVHMVGMVALLSFMLYVTVFHDIWKMIKH